jgi:Cu(I)/Ag(I) efflux system membrane fusion protein
MTVGTPGLDVRSAAGSEEAGVVTIDATRRQLIGVRTAPVTVAPMQSIIRAVGRIAYDETSLVDVSLKVRGWIVKLHADRTGQRVARGQTLFVLYSPDLYAAQQDLLVAKNNEALAKASRARLRLLGMSEGQIDSVANSGAPLENVAFASPASGFIIEKDVVEGGSVEAGARLFRIAGLDKVWVEAEIYESDLSHVKVGQHADVSLDYVADATYDGNVAYVYPYVDPKSRTGRIRIELPNQGLDLRPGMYGHVVLHADLGKRLQAPSSAVVYTGPRRLVFVDLGQGRFQPREVSVGAEADGMVEILSGLREGEVIATSGVFLIAAEARISAATKYWESADAGPPPVHSHASVTPPASIAPPKPGTLGTSAASTPTPVASDASTPPPVIYMCPMDLDIRSPTPGRCPKCGMELVPK